MKKGFTFLEILTGTAIMGLVSGIAFVSTDGVREQHRQRICAQNLKDIYQGLALYAADNAGPEQYPGLGDIKLVPQADRIMPYVKTNKIFYCPNTPPFRQTKLQYWSTYEINFVNAAADPNPKLHSFHDTFKTQLETLGKKMPLVICNMHDETYYGPREQDIDSDLALPFQIHLQLDGNVVAQRYVSKRHRSFTAQMGGS